MTNELLKLTGKDVAKYVRQDLKKQYPTLTARHFRVTSDYDSVNVTWEDYPNKQEVQEIVDNYVTHLYDDDLGVYRHTERHLPNSTQKFRGIKYTTINKTYSKERMELINKIATEQGDDVDNSVIDMEYYDSLIGHTTDYKNFTLPNLSPTGEVFLEFKQTLITTIVNMRNTMRTHIENINLDTIKSINQIQKVQSFNMLTILSLHLGNRVKEDNNYLYSLMYNTAITDYKVDITNKNTVTSFITNKYIPTILKEMLTIQETIIKEIVSKMASKLTPQEVMKEVNLLLYNDTSIVNLFATGYAKYASENNYSLLDIDNNYVNDSIIPQLVAKIGEPKNNSSETNSINLYNKQIDKIYLVEKEKYEKDISVNSMKSYIFATIYSREGIKEYMGTLSNTERFNLLQSSKNNNKLMEYILNETIQLFYALQHTTFYDGVKEYSEIIKNMSTSKQQLFIAKLFVMYEVPSNNEILNQLNIVSHKQVNSFNPIELMETYFEITREELSKHKITKEGLVKLGIEPLNKGNQINEIEIIEIGNKLATQYKLNNIITEIQPIVQNNNFVINAAKGYAYLVSQLLDTDDTMLIVHKHNLFIMYYDKHLKKYYFESLFGRVEFNSNKMKVHHLYTKPSTQTIRQLSIQMTPQNKEQISTLLRMVKCFHFYRNIEMKTTANKTELRKTHTRFSYISLYFPQAYTRFYEDDVTDFTYQEMKYLEMKLKSLTKTSSQFSIILTTTDVYVIETVDINGTKLIVDISLLFSKESEYTNVSPQMFAEQIQPRTKLLITQTPYLLKQTTDLRKKLR